MALDGSPQLEVLRSPYFLKLLTEQVEATGEMPEGRAGLFTGFVRQTLRREVEQENPLFSPDGAQNGPRERQRRLRTLLAHSDDQFCGPFFIDRKITRLHIQRYVQVIAPAAQFHQAIGLALRRALGQRQSAGSWEHSSKIKRPRINLGLMLFGYIQ